MKTTPSKILFVTSFFPVIIFKVLARVGEITPGRVKVAVVTGLVLAGGQYLLSRHFLKHTTYLEKAFLGFLAAGTAWIFLAPPESSMFFVLHSTSLLYLLLFLTTLLPQLFGYDPFTYAIAKQWSPEAVWNTPQFRIINLHITYFWSVIFFLATLSCWLGQEKPFFSVVVPLILVLGAGLPFSRRYPLHYLKRESVARPADPSAFSGTARELVLHMPHAFNPEAASGLKAEIQFDLLGEGGGKIVLSIADGRCMAREGEALSPSLTIKSPSDVWLKIARGEINRPKALMDGLFKVEGDISLLMKMGDIFHAPGQPVGGQETVTEVLHGKRNSNSCLDSSGKEDRAMKKSTVLVTLVLLAASTYAFQMCIGPSDAARIDSPMEKDGPAGTLTSLYAAVPRGGYIYVINPTLTDPKVAIELVRASYRGVDVRVIADRQKLEEHRERVVLYNLKHYAIPTKMHMRPEPLELRVSIINGTCVVTGTYEYDPRLAQHQALIAAAQRDKGMVHWYKALFDAMWNDAHSYETL